MKKNLALVILLLVALVTFTLPTAIVGADSTQNGGTSAEASSVRPTLVVKAPLAAGVGEKVQIKVAALPGGTPVGGAGLWAVDIKNGGDLTAAIASDVDGIGTFLGSTDNNGMLSCAFQNIGRYLLVAFKDGYTPGFTWINVQPLKEMTLKSPASAHVGETCEFKVFETNGGAPLAEVGIWAMPMDNATAVASVDSELLSSITSRGIFLGWTNNQGQVFHAFDKAGPYFLAAVKSGYKPSFNRITIDPLKVMAIRAPAVVRILEPVSIRVVEKSVLPVETPVVGAGVWALTYLNTLNSLTDYEAVKAAGIFLGLTDAEGYVSPQPRFQEAGHYYLIAFKDGFAPAVSKIAVEPLKDMTISGPEKALVGQTCEFTLNEAAGGAVVAGAGLWAILRADQPELNKADLDAAAFVKAHGLLLGWSDSQGKVFYSFEKPGQYLLMAFKAGYNPAFSRIAVEEIKEMVIRAPETVRVMAPVAIRIVEKSVLTVEIPVPWAGVWAISQDKTANLDKTSDFAVLAKSSGIFLGWTDQTGYVTPQPRFRNAGQFWLIAVKDGFAPGISQITVTGPQTATPVPKTQSLPSTASASAVSSSLKNTP